MLLRKAKLLYSIFIVCLLLYSGSFLINGPDRDVRLSSRSCRLRLQPSLSSSSTAAGPTQLPKVFVIGLSKTGTTSVGDALACLGLSRLGWEDIRSRFLFRSYLKGDISRFVSLTHYYNAFEDLPWALVYQDMARLYPDAKFILTLRANEQDWLKSIKGHTARRAWIGHDFVYGASQAQGHEETYLEAYRNHTSSVENFFGSEESQTRLLEWVIDGNETFETVELADKEKWGVLLRFLEMEDSEEVRKQLGHFPWANRTDSWKDKTFLKNVWWAWDVVMYYLEGSFLRIIEFLGRLLNVIG